MSADALQKQLQSEIDKFKSLQKAVQNSISTRQQLESQLNENTLVKKEIDLVEEDSKIYKMMGPVLVKQDKGEALSTVTKRIEYIGAELKRQEDMLQDNQSKHDAQKELVYKLQQEFQQKQGKAAETV